MTYKQLKEEIRSANLILTGLGEDLSGDLEAFYERLADLLKGKDYYIITLQDKAGLTKAGLLPERITAPCQEDEPADSWDRYMHWLGFTLNQKLCVLELGVGFARPELIRFPFEKTCYFNRKSRLVRIHEKFPQLPVGSVGRGISIKKNPVGFFIEDRPGEEEA